MTISMKQSKDGLYRLFVNNQLLGSKLTLEEAIQRIEKETEVQNVKSEY